jgi:hypothetical protein
MLQKLQYDGPVGLSYDDTKLLASFHPYYDEAHKSYFLMGHIGKPYQILNHKDFQLVIQNKELQKATKV